MNANELQRKLLAAARANPPGDCVPYMFEKRIIALLTNRPLPDAWAAWSRALWRAAALCMTIAALMGALAFFSLKTNVASNDLSQDFEQTLLAAVNQAEGVQ